MSKVELVGILNLTPDSFTDGARYATREEAIQHASEMFNAGASFVDVGAESTRPGAIPISSEEECRRLDPILPHIMRQYPRRISLDTYHPETVRYIAARYGRFIINDVTSFNNPDMVAVAAELQFPCIISHLPASFEQDIQKAHKNKQKIDFMDQVTEELLMRREQIMQAGIDEKNIILDPGIGFGKTQRLNWDLLAFAKEVPGIDVMIGYSCKSFLGETVKERKSIETNLIAGRIAVAAGAKYLRVHDVAGHTILTS